MTYVTDAGFVVGNKFKVVNTPGGIHTKFEQGDIVTLVTDDGSDAPKFKRDSDGETNYLRLCQVEAFRDTPAGRKGLVVGKQYVITGGYPADHDFPVGTVVTFTEDDGSGCPRFDGPNDAGDNWNYPSIEYIGAEVKPGEAVPTAVKFEDIIVQVPKDTTVITVNRKLTQAERAAIAEIINQ